MRFIVVTEKVIGTRIPNYCVKDTTSNSVLYRTLEKEKAENTAKQANLQGSD